MVAYDSIISIPANIDTIKRYSWCSNRECKVAVGFECSCLYVKVHRVSNTKTIFDRAFVLYKATDDISDTFWTIKAIFSSDVAPLIWDCFVILLMTSNKPIWNTKF